MNKINWRERFVAAAIHLVVTLLASGMAAALIFLVWFPNRLADLVGGTALFQIMIACDVVLGPLISLVIYDSVKPRRKLVIDYSLIGALQLTALVYGTYVVAASRPVFVIFDVRRLEIVAALELTESELAAGIEDRFRTKSFTGPRLVVIERPTNQRERSQLLQEELNGHGAYLKPKYYRDYDSALQSIRAEGQSIDTLLAGSDAFEEQIRDAVRATGKPEAQLRWLLVHHRFGFAVALLDSETSIPLRYIPVDPRWVK